jgi:hypothetical protein
MTHRYAAFGPSGGPNGGASWLYSHEFYVAQGPAHQEKLATAFMHELGHALNIHHGGGDGVNYKPNYHSILNYLWTYRSQNMDGFRTSWELNYSERAFNTLDENNLVEAAGIGGHPGHTTKVGPLPGQLMNEFGPVDWNGDGDMTDVITTGININGLAAPGPDDPEQIGATILFGHNDWANLFLNFRHSFKYREEFGLETGASEVAAGEHHHSHGGPTPEIVAQLDDIGYTNRAVRIHGLPDVYANEGDRIAFTVPTTDPEGDALTFALVPGAPSDASIHPMTGQFTWPTDAADGYGEYIITIQVTDSGSGRMREHNFGFIVDVGLTGDYNLNGVVDAADYVVWRNTLGTTGPLYAGADSSGNGIVDQADYLIWRANFGKTLPLPASGSSATAATDATESKVPTPPLFTRAENHAIHLSALAAGKFVQTDSQIIKSQQPRRNIQTVALSHDKALIGWLTSDAQATRREYPADNFKDQPGEMKGDASPKVLADAFDSVFAQHGFFT